MAPSPSSRVWPLLVPPWALARRSRQRQTWSCLPFISCVGTHNRPCYPVRPFGRWAASCPARPSSITSSLVPWSAGAWHLPAFLQPSGVLRSIHSGKGTAAAPLSARDDRQDILRTHDLSPTTDSSADRPTDAHPDPTLGSCSLCAMPARYRCDQCRRSLCGAHIMRPVRRQWQTFVAYGWAGSTWRRYILTGRYWQVCPVCSHAIDERDRRELARDRHDTLVRCIVGTVGLTLFAALLLLQAWSALIPPTVVPRPAHHVVAPVR